MLGSGGSTLNIGYEEVDAATAAEWLTRNDNNRSIRPRKVNEFKRDMIAGNWRNIGDPIRFDTNERLVDGQHRLLALVAADEEVPGIIIPLVIVKNVVPEDQVVIDTGTRRTAGDQLKMAGYKNPALLAATVKWLIFVERNALDGDAVSIKNVTHTEIIQWVEHHPDVQDVVQNAARVKADIDAPASFVAVVWFLTRKRHTDDADEFFERLSDGVGLPTGDPILALRNRFRDIRRDGIRLEGESWMSMLLRAWNARREGVPMKSVPLHYKGQPIPVPSVIR